MLNVCQQFHLSPSEAWLEIYERNPAGWVGSLLEVHQFRQAWQELKRDPEQKHLTLNRWHDQVQDIEAELAMAKQRRMQEQKDD